MAAGISDLCSLEGIFYRDDHEVIYASRYG